MKFLIIGTGGTGGVLGGLLAANGQDVTFIARGAHLSAMLEKGLKLNSELRGELVIPKVKACETKDYHDTPDVIFVCVKYYGLEDAIELTGRVAGPDTLVIPILNVYGTGERMRERLPGLKILDGCIYVSAYISAPGEITQVGEWLRVVYGNPDGSVTPPMRSLADTLHASGIKSVISEHVARDTMQKYVYISAMAAAGAYHNANTGKMRDSQEIMADFIALTEEIVAVANALGIQFEKDMVEDNRNRILTSPPETSTSMQRDMQKGGASEVDGLVFEPVRLAARLGVAAPTYLKIARKFGFDR